jgi:hypothetical protein
MTYFGVARSSEAQKLIDSVVNPIASENNGKGSSCYTTSIFHIVQRLVSNPRNVHAKEGISKDRVYNRYTKREAAISP